MINVTITGDWISSFMSYEFFFHVWPELWKGNAVALLPQMWYKFKVFSLVVQGLKVLS